MIASYIDVVATPTRAFCIASRPTSTVAEPTPPMSTTAPISAPRSVEANAEKSTDRRTVSNEHSTPRSKNVPVTLPIPKGTPPPPPPRTSRPSPYAKQFPNYLPVNALAPRKSDSSFSDYSQGGDVSPSLQSPNGSTSDVKVIAATEDKTNKKKDHKTNAAVEENVPEGEILDEDNLTDDEDGDNTAFLVREGPGRQSMSEKRFKLVQADITQTEFYKQRVTRSKSLEG